MLSLTTWTVCWETWLQLRLEHNMVQKNKVCSKSWKLDIWILGGSSARICLSQCTRARPLHSHMWSLQSVLHARSDGANIIWSRNRDVLTFADFARHLVVDLQTAFRLLPNVDAFIEDQEFSSAGELPCQMPYCNAKVTAADSTSWRETVRQSASWSELQRGLFCCDLLLTWPCYDVLLHSFCWLQLRPKKPCTATWSTNVMGRPTGHSLASQQTSQLKRMSLSWKLGCMKKQGDPICHDIPSV